MSIITSSNNKTYKDLNQKVILINKEYDHYKHILSKLADSDKKVFLRKQTTTLKNEIKTYIGFGYSEKEALDRVLPKAYGLVKLASDLIYQKPLYDVQLMGGIVLNEGLVSEMATGEGKTLTATLPVYLNALLGKGVHVVTPNDYLARRDQEETSKIYELLGLTCGLVVDKIKPTTEEIEDVMIELNKGPISNISKDNYIALRTKAIEEIKRRNIDAKKDAYDCDITYTSSSTLAFDYLKDGLSDTPEEIVQTREPNFVIIDEVDSVLFDDARTPFSISGTSKTKNDFRSDEYIKLAETEQEKIQKYPEKINQAILSIAILVGQMYNVDPGNNGLRTITKTHQISDIRGIARRFSKMPYVVEHPLPKSAKLPDLIEFDVEDNYINLTEEGNMLLYKYFKASEIFKFTKNNTNKIINTRDYLGRKKYVKGLDYVITSEGFARFTEFGLIKALKDRDFEELNKSYEKWDLEENAPKISINYNALTAYFNLVNGEDYQVKSTGKKTPSGKDEKSVSLIMNGRTAEGRVYSNGLQQALELKERSIAQRFSYNYDVVVSKYKDVLASIPSTAFFGRYPKVAGMTGTSAQEHFVNLYGIDTVKIPRNKPSRVVDHGEQLYFSKKEKVDAIVREILKSYRKGQPVLVSTTNVNESIDLANRIEKRLALEGITKKVPILNANISNLDEEARIISQAGLPGAITISTDMAGRGTDIKLGGEVPELITIVDDIIEGRVSSTLSILEKSGKISKQNRKEIEESIRKRVLSDQKEIQKAALSKRKALLAKQQQLKSQVKRAGGLKVIGAGHFPYTRVDNQVKGRCGRQGEEGEIIFISSDRDLENIGVTRTDIEKLKRITGGLPIYDDPSKGINRIKKVVTAAQTKFENTVAEGIRQGEEKEGYICKYREHMSKQKRALVENGDYDDAICYMIEQTASDLVKNVTKYNLSMMELASDIETCLGIRVRVDNLHQYSDLSELERDLASLGVQKFKRLISSKDKDEISNTNKKIVDVFMSRTWEDFLELVENYKHQEQLNAMANYDRDIPFETKLSIGFRNCTVYNRASIVKQILNPKTKNSLISIFPISNLDIEKKKERGKGFKKFKPYPRLYSGERMKLSPATRLGAVSLEVRNTKK